MLRPAAQSHLEDEEFGNSPAAPPAPGRLPPGSPLAPGGGRQRGIFRAVLSLRIRALSIGSRRSRSNQYCIKEGAPRDDAALARRGERGVLPRPPLVGRRARAPIPAQPRQAQPAPCAVHGQARCTFCQSPSDAGQTAELWACPSSNEGACFSAAVLGCGGLLQQEPGGGGSCPGIPALGPAVELGGRRSAPAPQPRCTSVPPAPQALSKPKPDRQLFPSKQEQSPSAGHSHE